MENSVELALGGLAHRACVCVLLDCNSNSLQNVRWMPFSWNFVYVDNGAVVIGKCIRVYFASARSRERESRKTQFEANACWPHPRHSLTRSRTQTHTGSRHVCANSIAIFAALNYCFARNCFASWFNWNIELPHTHTTEIAALPNDIFSTSKPVIFFRSKWPLLYRIRGIIGVSASLVCIGDVSRFHIFFSLVFVKL